MNAAVKLIDHTAILVFEKEHEHYERVIVGGADGILITIDSQGHIHVRPPEGPGPTERVRGAVEQIARGVETLGELARVE